jgi:hypothetical protein
VIRLPAGSVARVRAIYSILSKTEYHRNVY